MFEPEPEPVRTITVPKPEKCPFGHIDGVHVFILCTLLRNRDCRAQFDDYDECPLCEVSKIEVRWDDAAKQDWDSEEPYD